MKITLSAVCSIFVLMAGLAWAEHPGVATSHRDAIQKAMMTHIEEITENNATTCIQCLILMPKSWFS